jgi:RNA polymerase sigma-54 factor
MALEQKLSLKLTQKLVMTPSLQQAIKLLQMTRLELEGTLAQELVENPVLEENTETTEEAEAERAAAGTAPEANAGEQAAEKAKDPLEQIDFEAYFSDYMEGSGYASIREEREEAPIENSLTREPDLYDHLLWQLHMSDAPAELREIAEMIIGNLDPDGFLVATVEEICRLCEDVDAAPPAGEVGANGAAGGLASQDPAVRSKVERALALVRSLDPPGIARESLRESLLAQLEALEVASDSLAWRMLAEHWELFLRRQFPQLAKLLGVELKDLEPAVELIRGLETRPGRKFTTERAHYIEPDVSVRKIGGEYVVQLNDDGLPRLRVSKAYRRMLQQMRRDGNESEAQQFIKEKMRSAVWLIKSLDQRQRTIYKVANSIVQQQRAFLDHGIEHLRPMVLRDVAEDIGMHESTVSRVVSNKYMHTPRGLFPMKFFFHSGIDREYGDNISSLTVKRKLQQMVHNEDPRRPLSDSELMKILNREGIQIARRTVAKYREELGISSSTERKQIF